MRGEDWFHPFGFMDDGGSPPHARGRRQQAISYPVCRRITPACAGKTTKKWQRHTPMPDHPRMRGEDSVRIHSISSLYGSPPHARGRLCLPPPLSGPGRITPACAGKTRSFPGPFRPGRDHPRMRGEDVKPRFDPSPGLGSPPHARGRPGDVPGNHRQSRITPACAGKTRKRLCRLRHSPDHPRMRGEDPVNFASELYGSGSPPHARGRPTNDHLWVYWVGITPACAGKTDWTCTGRCSPWDHPRMRGEDRITRRRSSLLVGSPPHARGRPSFVLSYGVASGITPACAGKTESSS